MEKAWQPEGELTGGNHVASVVVRTQGAMNTVTWLFFLLLIQSGAPACEQSVPHSKSESLVTYPEACLLSDSRYPTVSSELVPILT